MAAFRTGADISNLKAMMNKVSQPAGLQQALVMQQQLDLYGATR
jgi:hypothetical protein